MSSYAWRQLGLTYIQYSNACARAVRNSLKPELKVEGLKRGNSLVKVTRWAEGKPVTSPQAKAAKGSG
ncbi:ATP synthase F(1) complex subunit epsilon, mitochondrial-like [Crassostrea virginica]